MAMLETGGKIEHDGEQKESMLNLFTYTKLRNQGNYMSSACRRKISYEGC